MRKYSDMWVARDTDGRYIIAYTMPGIGHVMTKPFTFETMAPRSVTCKMYVI